MPIFTALHPLVLASSSPRRRRFLADLGLEFRLADGGRECLPEPGEDPAAFACRAALDKARFAARNEPAAVVLGADTVVSLDGRIFGKPRNAGHALDMLRQLNNRTHSVISACAVIIPAGIDPAGRGGETLCRAQSRVSFWDVPPEALAAYAQSEEPIDKAGAYAIQGQGAFLVREARGSVSAVVGLPLAELLEVLLRYTIISGGETR